MNQIYNITPSFIDGTAGPLFTLHYAPQSIDEHSECFIIAPSFAEEMNRCRYMCTMLAQSLSSKGYGFLSVDPYGTGDSAGEFIETDWDQGCKDLLTSVAHAENLGYKKISLVGIRLGALQVMNIAADVNNLKRIIFWQPVINGQNALTQFLRIKIAASIGRDEKAGTIKDFDEQINRNEHVEVAGYDVSPGLYNGIKQAKFENHIDLTSVPIAWFTTIASEERSVPRADLKMIEKWQGLGATIESTTVIGPQYWHAHERTLVPELVTATCDYITRTNNE